MRAISSGIVRRSLHAHGEVPCAVGERAEGGRERLGVLSGQRVEPLGKRLRLRGRAGCAVPAGGLPGDRRDEARGLRSRLRGGKTGALPRT